MNTDADELLRLRITEQVTNSVETALRRRYFILGAIAIAVISVMSTILVDWTLDNATDKLEVAEALQRINSERLDRAANLVEEMERTARLDARRIQSRMEREGQKIEELSDNIDALSRRLQKASETNILLSGSLQKDIEDLGNILESVIEIQGKPKEETLGDLPALQEEILSIIARFSESDEEILTAEKEADLLRHHILVRDAFERSKELVRLFETRGFTVSSIGADDEIDHYNTILLDSNLPVSEAAYIVREAKRLVPSLRYVIDENHEIFPISDEPTENRTFIGLWLDEEEEERLGPLSESDFEKLVAAGQSLSEFREKFSTYIAP